MRSLPARINGGSEEGKMTRFLQANLQRNRLATELLSEVISTVKIDVAIISEQYRNPNTSTWFAGNTGTAAIWVLNPNLQILEKGVENGFVWVKAKQYYIVSCYFTLNESIKDFREKVERLVDCLRSVEGRKIVAGDLNAKVSDWGMPYTDSRGKALTEMVARLSMEIMNEGISTTFRSAGYTETIIDLTLCSESLAPQVINWQCRATEKNPRKTIFLLLECK